jgi:restriction system-associated AAA family ATPase
MKLLRLKLNSDFRSLQEGFEIHFLRDFEKKKVYDFNPYCLAGKNGSGKSNILEALAAIFYHIECIYLNNKPEGFEGEGTYSRAHTDGFFAEASYPNAFELEYLIPVKWKQITKSFSQMGDTTWDELFAHIRITKKKNEAPILACLNKSLYESDYKEQKLLREEVKDILPDYIIGYSSGENEILSLPFFKMRFINFDEYEDRLRNEFDYQRPEGRLVYIDNQFSQAVFLANFLMQDESLLKPIYKTIGVKRIKQFRIIIQQNVQIPKFLDEQTEPVDQLTSDRKQGVSFELTSKLQNTIDKFKSCATTKFFDAANKILYLDYFVTDETKKAFHLMFEGDALVLFRAFQVLLTLNLYEVSRTAKEALYKSGSLYVNETVPILSSDKRIMRFNELEIDKEFTVDDIYNKSLSDGEHQFLHSMNLCLLFKNTNSLFLLDEPETHFNPSWRAKFISTLRDCLKDEKQQRLRELLITTHSPFIISDSHEENVLKFTKSNETGIVKCERPDFNTFGASVNQITIKIFGKVETIGNYAKEELDKLYARFENGENPEKLINEADKLLGDSVEKILFEKHITEKKL